ncbi:MAG: PHP domain-containing protein [Phycisphaerae bacterium]|nr:PHP domain-containing protein [Gemmatimonadaceae bacterium]
MKNLPNVQTALALALFTAVAPGLQAQVAAQPSHWFRGNTHAHTLESDGDSPPDSVARWYRDRGYHFLFITDHEKLTDPEPLNARYAVAGKFLLIPGQEVTQRVVDSTHVDKLRQAHVNALGASHVVMPQGDKGLAKGITMKDGYATNIAGIRSAGGIAQVNHPNFRWSVRLADLLAIPDSTLLEVMNAHTGVNNDGDGAKAPSTEALWDSLLTRGKIVFAVGDDDAHSFRATNADAYELTRPGRAWIVVRADTLTAASILAGIRRGDFYASDGVMFKEYTANTKEVRISIQAVYDARYRTEFIGANGQVLATVSGLEATYTIRGTEGYVRVRVTDSNGHKALSQASFIRR